MPNTIEGWKKIWAAERAARLPQLLEAGKKGRQKIAENRRNRQQLADLKKAIDENRLSEWIDQ
jgi:hypothetical protein